MKCGLIVASDESLGIGKDGGLPWHLSEDLKRFKRLTLGEGKNAVLMGRRTWESLPEKVRPLPGRQNLVLSSQEQQPYGVRSIEEALALAKDKDWCWIIGGQRLFQEALQMHILSRIEWTRLDGHYDCDTFWPGPPPSFERRFQEQHPGYRFESWERKV